MSKHKSTAVILAFALHAALSAQSLMKPVGDALSLLTTAIAPAALTNSTIGSQWSEAWIGDLIAIPPHFGVGLTAGSSSIPLPSVKPLFEAVGVVLPDFLNSVGVPLPATVVNAKVGGIILPFDLGVKVGLIPDAVTTALKSALPGFTLEYLLIGADVRYALVKQDLLLPNVVVGVGYSMLTTKIGMDLPIDAPSFTFNDGNSNHTLALTKPTMVLEMEASTIDVTAQVSKNLLIVTPYAGAGCTFGIGKTRAGLKTSLTYDNNPVTAAEVEAIKDALKKAGIDMPELSAEGLFYSGSAAGPVLRVFGGVSLNVVVVRFDLSAFYNISGNSLGFQFGTRVQF